MLSTLQYTKRTPGSNQGSEVNLANPQFLVNGRLPHITAADVDLKYQSVRPKDTVPAGLEDGTSAASQRINNRLTLL